MNLYSYQRIFAEYQKNIIWNSTTSTCSGGIFVGASSVLKKRWRRRELDRNDVLELSKSNRRRGEETSRTQSECIGGDVLTYISTSFGWDLSIPRKYCFYFNPDKERRGMMFRKDDDRA